MAGERAWQKRRLVQWTVRIVLECILVTACNEVGARLYFHRRLSFWRCLLLGGVCSQGVPVPGGGGSAPGGTWSWVVLGVNPPETATAVGGTHPTGMHSCLVYPNTL